MTTDAQRGQGRGYLAYLDGARGCAALFVVLTHVLGFYTDHVEGVIGFFLNPFLYGHFAVDLFIVLSGFCLALSAGRLGRVEDLVPYLRKRARRILPPF